MKGFIKTGIIAICCMFAFCNCTMAGKDTPIRISQLPPVAQKIIKAHFSKGRVAMAKMETDWLKKSYDVVFTNGTKIEFDENGNWKDIECKHSAVPSALVPVKITKYVRSHYPHSKILKIERDRKGYEIELSGDIDITFNKNFEVTEID